MGAKRKPTAQKVVEGSFRKHPERRNANEPTPAGELGEAPDFLSANERDAWAQIANECCPGVLGNSDRIAVERASRLLAASRSDAGITAAQETALYRYLAAFGMSPSDRSRITVPNTGGGNPFDGL